jgi:hypothetical protein
LRKRDAGVFNGRDKRYEKKAVAEEVLKSPLLITTGRDQESLITRQNKVSGPVPFYSNCDI